MAAFALVAATAIPLLLPSYWVFLCMTAVIFAVALQSVGIAAGRTGMISLCQMSFAGVGAWIVAWLNVNDVPVDAFWSVSVYNAAGYYEKNPLNAYTLNNLTAQKSGDGAIAIRRSYSETIVGQSVSSRVGAPACTAAIAASM